MPYLSRWADRAQLLTHRIYSARFLGMRLHHLFMLEINKWIKQVIWVLAYITAIHRQIWLCEDSLVTSCIGAFQTVIFRTLSVSVGISRNRDSLVGIGARGFGQRILHRQILYLVINLHIRVEILLECYFTRRNLGCIMSLLDFFKLFSVVKTAVATKLDKQMLRLLFIRFCVIYSLLNWQLLLLFMSFLCYFV